MQSFALNLLRFNEENEKIFILSDANWSNQNFEEKRIKRLNDRSEGEAENFTLDKFSILSNIFVHSYSIRL